MTALVSFLLAFAGVVVSARIRLSAIVLGRPVSVPLPGLVLVVLVLVLAGAVLWLARSLLREGLQLKPRPVTR